MKYYLIPLLLIISSCSIFKDRTVAKKDESYLLVNKSVVTTKTKSDVIILTAPRTPKDRPKDTTIVYNGKNGATATVSYDEEGFLDNQIIYCPEEEETKRLNITEEYDLKTKDIESKANIELAKVIGNRAAISLIVIGGFFAFASYKKP